MNVPELRVGNSNGHPAVFDLDGKLQAVFYGKFAVALADYCATFTEAVKLMLAAQKLEASDSVPFETVTPVVTTEAKVSS